MRKIQHKKFVVLHAWMYHKNYKGLRGDSSSVRDGVMERN
jgi:hypothetical protein